MIHPLVRETAVACRALNFAEQAYCQWLKNPISAREAEEQHLLGVVRELHDEDPERD